MPGWRFDFIGDKDAENLFNQLLDSVKDLVSFSFGKGILGILNNGEYFWTRIAKSLENELKLDPKRKPIYVNTGGNRYYVRFDDGKCAWHGNRTFQVALQKCESTVRSVAFAPCGGWFILFEDGNAVWHYLPRALHHLLSQKNKAGVKVNKLTISPDGYWYVSFFDGSWRCTTPPQFDAAHKQLLKEFRVIDNVWLGYGGAFIILYGSHMKTTTLSPQDILFSKKSIPAHFDDHSSVKKTISDLKKKTLCPEFISPIHIVKKDDKWISLDNRRLFAFQEVNISEILVILVNHENLETVDGYASVQISSCNCNDCCFTAEKSEVQVPARLLPSPIVEKPVQPPPPPSAQNPPETQIPVQPLSQSIVPSHPQIPVLPPPPPPPHFSPQPQVRQIPPLSPLNNREFFIFNSMNCIYSSPKLSFDLHNYPKPPILSEDSFSSNPKHNTQEIKPQYDAALSERYKSSLDDTFSLDEKLLEDYFKSRRTLRNNKTLNAHCAKPLIFDYDLWGGKEIFLT